MNFLFFKKIHCPYPLLHRAMTSSPPPRAQLYLATLSRGHIPDHCLIKLLLEPGSIAMLACLLPPPGGRAVP